MAAPRPKEGPKQKEKQKSENLKYLKKEVDSPLPNEITGILTFLDEEEARLTNAISNRANRLELVQDASMRANLLEANQKDEQRIRDISMFRKLLYAHGANPNVSSASKEMNEVYEKMFGKKVDPEFEKKNFYERARDVVDRLKGLGNTPQEAREVLHQKYVAGNEKLDDTLDKAQTDHLLQMSATGHPDAFFETYVTNVDRYKELTDKIFALPKPERDKNIDVLLRTLDFYEGLASGEILKKKEEEIRAAGENLLKNQQKQFEGVRGMVQRGIERGADFAINGLANFLGDQDSIARSVFVAAAKAGKDLSKPVNYEPELVEKVVSDTINQVKDISSAVDVNAVRKMREACIELKANPDRLLTGPALETAKGDFMAAFKDFMPATVTVIKKIVDVQSVLLRDAYVYSHGEKNSDMFDSDWTLRAKFFDHEGQDLVRLLRVYSPFGIFMPTDVQKKDGTPVYIQSAYNQGWFKEHPYLSTAFQSVAFMEMYNVGIGLLGLVATRLARPKILVKALRKLLSKPMKKVIPFVGQVWLGKELGESVFDIALTREEIDLFNKINEYDNFADIPEDVRKEIRERLMLNEIHRRRQLFQDVGYNLGKLDVGIIDRLFMGNLGTGIIDGPRDTMVQTGAFREAVYAANRKIVLLGMEPYELDLY